MGVLIQWSEGGVGLGCRQDGSMCYVGHKFLEKNSHVVKKLWIQIWRARIDWAGHMYGYPNIQLLGHKRPYSPLYELEGRVDSAPSLQLHLIYCYQRVQLEIVIYTPQIENKLSSTCNFILYTSIRENFNNVISTFSKVI